MYKGFNIPLLVNLYASFDRLETAFGTDIENIAKKTAENMDTDLPLRYEEGGEYDEIAGLDALPMPRFYEDTSGSVNMGCVIYCGFRSGIYRIEPVAPGRAVIHCRRGSGLHRSAAKGADITVAVGCSPYLFYASACSPGSEAENLKIAGVLGTKFMQTEKFPVPSDTNVIIQGRLTGETADGGRFFNYTGGYTQPEPFPVMEIESVRVRRGGVLQSTVTGIPPMESAYIGVAAARAHFYRIKEQFSEILDIKHPLDGIFSGVCRVFCSRNAKNIITELKNDHFYGKFAMIDIISD